MAKIEPGSERGIELGFVASLFEGYLYELVDTIQVSASLISKQPRCGNFSRLLSRLEETGKTILCKNPFPHMELILRSKGYTLSYEHDAALCDRTEVWSKFAGPVARADTEGRKDSHA